MILNAMQTYGHLFWHLTLPSLAMCQNYINFLLPVCTKMEQVAETYMQNESHLFSMASLKH